MKLKSSFSEIHFAIQNVFTLTSFGYNLYDQNRGLDKGLIDNFLDIISDGSFFGLLLTFIDVLSAIAKKNSIRQSDCHRIFRDSDAN